ncbi:Pycsar system effector family protein [Streptomyces klenkii]
MTSTATPGPTAPDAGPARPPTPAPDALIRARTETSGEINRTDSKAAALLTAFGIPLAVLVAAVPGRHLPAGAATLVGLGAVGLVAAMLVVLLVVRPRLGGDTRGSFLDWADRTPEEVLADLTVERHAERIIAQSRIARTKFRALRLAIDITAGALTALVLALLAGLIGW